MKLQVAELKGFGKFVDRKFEFSDGINIAYGPNEAGKSTITAFLYAMLFDLDSDENDAFRKDMFTACKPWIGTDEFGGAIEFVHNGGSYRLEKSFAKNGTTLKLKDLSTGHELYPAAEHLRDMFPGLTSREYLGTYFNVEGENYPDVSIVQSIKKHMADKKRENTKGIDTDYAIEMLEERKLLISQDSDSEKIKKLDKIIAEEEKTERELDKIAAMELKGLAEVEELNVRYAELSKLSLFEEKEQDYYTYKERYLTYKKDLEKAREISDQLETTIIRREELDENAGMLDRCKEELQAVRSFMRDNSEKEAKARQSIDTTGRLLISEAKDNQYKQIIFLGFAIFMCLAGLVTILEKIPLRYSIICFIAAIGCTAAFIMLTIKGKGRRSLTKDELAKLKDRVTELDGEKKMFFRAHSSEEELIVRLENCLKEDGRRPDVVAKEEELMKELQALDEDLAKRKDDLFKFFSQFGMLENLKDDELFIQEGALLEAAAKRKSELAELKKKISGLKESLLKMHMQVEAGEENEAHLLEHRNEKKQILDKKKEREREIKAIEMAISMINELSKENNSSIGKAINERASSYAAAFTDNRYTSFSADDSLNCRVDYYDKYVDVGRLSNGTRKQMNMALKLSAGDLILSDYELPIVFDDSFVYYDDSRLAATLKRLSEMHGKQIIIFTCQSREETILNQLGINYSYLGIE